MKIGPFTFEFYNPRKHRPVFYGMDHFAFRDGECRPFAYADVTAILRMITDRLRNCEWQSDKEYEVLEAMFAFLKANRLEILQKFFYEGFVRIDVTNPFIPCFDGQRDRDRDNDEDVVTVLDDIYRTTGKTMAEILDPHISLLDTINNSDLNLLKNYGAMGLLSPENSQHADGYLDDEQMKGIQEEYRRQYGITFGRWGMLITRNPVKFQPIQLPIAALQLVEKRRIATSSILQFLNVPKELHVLFESAKYANRNEAELDMYGNCVSSWAEKYSEIASRCYDRIRRTDKNGIGYAADNDIWFDFAGVPALQEAQYTEKQKAREEMAMWREMLAAMPEKADYINTRIDDLIESL